MSDNSLLYGHAELKAKHLAEPWHRLKRAQILRPTQDDKRSGQDAIMMAIANHFFEFDRIYKTDLHKEPISYASSPHTTT